MRVNSPRVRFSVFLFLMGASSCTSTPKENDVPETGVHDQFETIAILGTNDIHGALAPEKLKTREPQVVPPTDYEAGGAAMLASFVRALRNQFGTRLIWLDGGDEFQGSIESNGDKGASMVRFFNYAGLSAAAVGNHEFDFGPELPSDSSDKLGAIKARMSEARYPYLAANIMDKSTGKLARFPNTLPSLLLPVGQLKVGIVGLSTRDTPKTTRTEYVTSLDFVDLKEATVRESKTLRDAGAQIVVITSHVGLFCDGGSVPSGHLLRKESDPQGKCKPSDEMVKLLESLPPGTVDAVVSGHSHSVVHHWVSGVPVVQGGSFGRYFNLIYLTYDWKQGKLAKERTRIEGPVPVCPRVFQNQGDCHGDRSPPKQGRGPLITPRFHGMKMEPDSGALDLLQSTFERAANAKKEILATAARPIERPRSQESEMGNLVADAVRILSKADISLVNGGGIRAPLQQGAITFGDVFKALPFDNSIVLLKVTGRELKLILQIAESGSRGVAPVSGLKIALLKFDEDAPAQDLDGNGKVEPWEVNRVLDVRLENGKKIQDHQYYTLATVDFLAAGGDDVGWAMKKVPKNRHLSTDLVMRDALKLYLQDLQSKQGSINSETHTLLDPANPRFLFKKAGRKKKGR